jgi:hypothetical protein
MNQKKSSVRFGAVTVVVRMVFQGFPPPGTLDFFLTGEIRNAKYPPGSSLPQRQQASLGLPIFILH